MLIDEELTQSVCLLEVLHQVAQSLKGGPPQAKRAIRKAERSRHNSWPITTRAAQTVIRESKANASRSPE